MSTYPEVNPTPGDVDKYKYTNYLGNITYKEHITGNTSASYQYDNKLSPYIHWASFDNMLMIFPHISKKNPTFEQNYINGVNAGQVRFEYVYNEHNYPEQVNKYNNVNDQLIETITYSYYTY